MIGQAGYQLGTHIAAKAWTLLYLMGMGRARATSLPMRVSLTPGEAGLPHGLTCNPLFLEALMGWPLKWTDTASPVTEFALWRERMRWRLWRLLRENEVDMEQ